MSFRLKTILGIGIIEMVLLIILVGNSLRFLSNTQEAELNIRASTTATLFATTIKDALLSSDLASLESFVEEVLKNPGIAYARVISEDGVLAETGDIEVSRKLFIPDTGLDSVKDGVFDTYAEITEGGKVYGRVEIGLSVAELKSNLEEAKTKTLGIAGFELVLSALFSFILGTYLTNRLKKLEEAAKKIAIGDLTIDVSEQGSDELAQLGKAFNTMSDNLVIARDKIQHSQNELVATNQNLEKIIQERTQDLVNKNTELEKTMSLLAEEQKKQLTQAYSAGIAENAISVLHNIGNAITPAVVNNELLISHQNNLFSIVDYLRKFQQLFVEHHQFGKLDHFLSEDDKGKRMLPFLSQFANQLETHIGEENKMLESTNKQLKHISNVISLQQKYANIRPFQQKFQIPDLIQDVLGMMQVAFKRTNIEIVNNISSDLPEITCDKNKLVQVLMNILKNSAESIEEQLKHSPEKHSQIQIKIVAETSDFISFSIHDTGIGIDPDNLKSVFNFGYSTKERGSGFGLHDCANFINSNKGKITIKSSGIGSGVTVEFTLPVSLQGYKI